MSYSEQLRAQNAREAARPKRQYLTGPEYSRLKSELTRAKNSGDGQRVLRAVAKAVERFNATTWPDAWSTWRIALEDAARATEVKARDTYDYDEQDRLEELARELHAASLVLFRF